MAPGRIAIHLHGFASATLGGAVLFELSFFPVGAFLGDLITDVNVSARGFDECFKMVGIGLKNFLQLRERLARLELGLPVVGVLERAGDFQFTMATTARFALDRVNRFPHVQQRQRQQRRCNPIF